ARGLGVTQGLLVLGILLLMVADGLRQALDERCQALRMMLRRLSRLLEALGLLQTLQPARPVLEGLGPVLQRRQPRTDLVGGVEQARLLLLLRVLLLQRAGPACSRLLKVPPFVIKLLLQLGKLLIER